MYIFRALSTSAVVFIITALCTSLPNSPAPVPISQESLDKWAWQLFIAVNRPTNNDLYWETWATPASIFDRPETKPQWSMRGRHILELTPIFKTHLSSAADRTTFVNSNLHPAPCSSSFGEEVRLNQSTVEYIAENNLYNLEGQIARSKKGPVEFRADSIEVKAFWNNISEAEKSNFYWRRCGKLLYGLTALHITSKRVPQWIWVTFEHISIGRNDLYNPDQCKFIKCVDKFGSFPTIGGPGDPFRFTPTLVKLFESEGMGRQWRTTWRHYRLVGAQINFNQPLLLGNSVLENSFANTSSCITCHVRSSIADNATRLLPEASPNVSFNGGPDVCWFTDAQGNVIYKRLDFVWSLLQAKSRVTGQPAEFISRNCHSGNSENRIPTKTPPK